MQDDERKIDSYKTLKVYQKTICIFDITCYFVERFLDRGHDRTVDQMQQAARSGKQNIVEGYSDAETLAMLHGYIKFINRKFLEQGGVKEQRYWKRVQYRDGRFGREQEPNTPTTPTKPTTPTTPLKQ